MDKIEELRNDPFPHKVKRVEGRKEKIFRVRVGDYRILYVVLKERNIIFVSKIDKRGGVYD
jgi:mRNA interferase RelE/StbE